MIFFQNGQTVTVRQQHSLQAFQNKFGNNDAGIISQKSGNSASNTRIISDETKYGRQPLKDLSMLRFPIEEAKSKHKPYGGVTSPSESVQTVIKPSIILFMGKVPIKIKIGF